MLHWPFGNQLSGGMLNNNRQAIWYEINRETNEASPTGRLVLNTQEDYGSIRQLAVWYKIHRESMGATPNRPLVLIKYTGRLMLHSQLIVGS